MRGTKTPEAAASRAVLLLDLREGLLHPSVLPPRHVAARAARAER